MSSATHDWERSPHLSEKTLDGSVGGPPPKSMLWVFVTATLLLVGIIAVSLVNGESAHRLDSELTALPRQPDLQLDNAATASALSTSSSTPPAVNACLDLHAYVCGGYAGAVGRPLEEYVAANITAAIKRHFLTLSEDDTPKKGRRSPPTPRALAAFLERNELTFRSVDGVDLLGKALELLMRYDLQVFFALKAQFLPQPNRNKSFVRVVDSSVLEEWEARKADLSRDDFTKYVGNVLSLSGVDQRRMAHLTNCVRSVEDHVQKARRADVKPVVEATTAAWRRYLNVHTGHVYSGLYRLDVESSSGARHLRAAARVLDGGQRSIYLSWHVARHVAEVARLVSRHSGDSDDDAKAYCYDQAYGEYKHAVMAAYLFKFINRSRIREVRKIVGSIAKEVRKSIRRSFWLPTMTRAALENKVRRIKWRIGYPARLGEWAGVDDFYGRHPRPTGVFVADYLGARKARMRAFFAALRAGNVSETDGFDFANDAPGVVYYGAPNEVSVPAVALMRPLFNYRGAPELNYGLLGSLLLDAIMRAFDGANMMDDGHGFRVLWPTIQRRLFRVKYSCDDLRGGPLIMSQAFKRNSRSRTPPSPKGRARTSRPAVSVGAHALFRAYKRAAASFDGGRSGRSLRGLEALSGDQVFHVARCFLSCGDTHDGSADPLFAGHRCNRMARQSPEFASAFRCNRASWTPSRSLCDLW
ncbi:hypothetical protein MTO96_032553 [Rhipicephalus appendiculatus]